MTPAAEPRYPELDEVLLEQPFDRETLLIYADWLQDRGEPRGQLITLQLRGARADPERLAAAEQELLDRHRDRLVPRAVREVVPGRLDWSGGFVRRLAVTPAWASIVTEGRLAEVLTHPSLRFVAELDVELDDDSQIDLAARALAAHPLPGLRQLAFRRARDWGEVGSHPIAPVVASAPWLESLAICSGLPWKPLTHPRLASLRFAHVSAVERADCLRALARSTLPALHTLTLGRVAEDELASLVPLLARCPVRLQRLCLRHHNLPPAARVTLAPVADHIDLGVEADLAGNWFVRHRVRAEWGIGRVLSSDGRGATVRFEDGQTRKIQRMAQFLEPVDDATVPSGSPLRPPPPPRRRTGGPSPILLAKALEVGLRALVKRLHDEDRFDSWLKHQLDRGGKLLAVDVAVLAGGGKGQFRQLRAAAVRTLLRQRGLADIVDDLRASITSLQREPRNVRLEAVGDWEDADRRLAAIAACERAGAIATTAHVHDLVAAAAAEFVPSYLLHCSG